MFHSPAYQNCTWEISPNRKPGHSRTVRQQLLWNDNLIREYLSSAKKKDICKKMSVRLHKWIYPLWT